MFLTWNGTDPTIPIGRKSVEDNLQNTSSALTSTPPNWASFHVSSKYCCGIVNRVEPRTIHRAHLKEEVAGAILIRLADKSVQENLIQSQFQLTARAKPAIPGDSLLKLLTVRCSHSIRLMIPTHSTLDYDWGNRLMVRFYRWPACFSDIHGRFVWEPISNFDVVVLEELSHPTGGVWRRYVGKPRMDVRHLR
jgi:hypothetical protein